MKLAELTYPQVERVATQSVALWPMGATEAHGPHLPLGTDVIIAEETCRRSVAALQSRGLGAVILPAYSISVAEYAGPFAGTLSVPKSVAVAYIKAVIESAAAQGFKAVCLVNAHLEPAHRFALRDAVKAAQSTVPVLLADPGDRRWVPTLTAEFQSGKCHAGQYEGSLVLAAGVAVDEAQMRALPKVDIDLVAAMKQGLHTFAEMGAEQAYFGDPAAATKNEGEATYQRLVEMVVATITEALEQK